MLQIVASDLPPNNNTINDEPHDRGYASFVLAFTAFLDATKWELLLYTNCSFTPS